MSLIHISLVGHKFTATLATDQEEMPLDQRKDKRASPHKPNVNKAHYG